MKNEFTISGINDQELIIREGKAPDIELPMQLSIRGQIDAVSRFFLHQISDNAPLSERFSREQRIDFAKSIVFVNRDQRVIQFLVDPNYLRATKLVAVLELNPDLDIFKINTGTPFGQKDLIKLLRFNSRFFFSPEECKNMLTSAMKMEFTSQIDGMGEKDIRGNRNENLVKKLDVKGMPMSFQLLMPLFKGQPKNSFTVEVVIDSNEQVIKVYFESPMLAELLETERDRIIDVELDKIKGLNIIEE